MVEVIKYWGLTSIAIMLLLGVNILLLAIFEAVFRAKSSEVSNWAVAAFFVSSILLAGPVAHYSLHRLGMLPPGLAMQTPSVDSQAASLIELGREAGELNRLIQDPDKMTISELSAIAERSLALTGNLQERVGAQSALISQLQAQVKSERERAEEATEIAANIQALTREQLDAVKLLLTEDARAESRRSTTTGILISFPLGFVASLLASVAHRRLGVRIGKDIKKVSERVEGGR